MLGMEGWVLWALGGHPAHPCASPGVGRLKGKPRACPLPTGVPSQQPRQGEGRGRMEDSTMDRTPTRQALSPSTLQAGPRFLPLLVPLSPISPMPLPCFPAWHQFPPVLCAQASQQDQQEARTQQASTQTCRLAPSPWFMLTLGHQHTLFTLLPRPEGRASACLVCVPSTGAHLVIPGRAAAPETVWVRTPAALGGPPHIWQSSTACRGAQGPTPPLPTRHPGNVYSLDRARGCSDGHQVGLPC